MELLSFGLYLFSLVFLLFPFLLSCLSCDSFCWLPFRLRFFLLVPFVFSYLVFPPAAFAFCQVSAFRLQVFFSSCGFVFPSGFAFWNEAKTKATTKAKFTTASHEPGQEQANLLPHPATTATTTIATAGPSFCCRHLSYQHQQSTNSAGITAIAAAAADAAAADADGAGAGSCW